MKVAQLPARFATGAYIFHSGLQKWDGDEETAQALHGMTAGAYPVVERLEPRQFLRMLSIGEMAVGAAVAVPLVPERLAGLALTAFGSALMGLYYRTPGMRQEGSIWPTQQGIGLAKDAWLVGVGANLLVSSLGGSSGSRKQRTRRELEERLQAELERGATIRATRPAS